VPPRVRPHGRRQAVHRPGGVDDGEPKPGNRCRGSPRPVGSRVFRGRNLAVEYRWAEDHYERLPEQSAVQRPFSEISSRTRGIRVWQYAVCAASRIGSCSRDRNADTSPWKGRKRGGFFAATRVLSLRDGFSAGTRGRWSRPSLNASINGASRLTPVPARAWPAVVEARRPRAI
jgi:hypothetical protein